MRAAGISVVRAYDCLQCSKNVRGHWRRKGLTRVPADLDTKPYRDEHDYDLLKRMEAAEKRGKLPSGVDPGKLRHALEHVSDAAKPTRSKQVQALAAQAPHSQDRCPEVRLAWRRCG